MNCIKNIPDEEIFSQLKDVLYFAGIDEMAEEQNTFNDKIALRYFVKTLAVDGIELNDIHITSKSTLIKIVNHFSEKLLPLLKEAYNEAKERIN